jgi:NAD+ diphosphatase
MVGFYATADSSKPVRTDLDNELAGIRVFPSKRIAGFEFSFSSDARWYTREEVLLVLRHPAGTGLRTKDRQTPLAESHTQTPAEPPLFTMPGVKAIAGVLVKDWAEGRITHLGTRVANRGNL